MNDATRMRMRAAATYADASGSGIGDKGVGKTVSAVSGEGTWGSSPRLDICIVSQRLSRLRFFGHFCRLRLISQERQNLPA